MGAKFSLLCYSPDPQRKRKRDTDDFFLITGTAYLSVPWTSQKLPRLHTCEAVTAIEEWFSPQADMIFSIEFLESRTWCFSRRFGLLPRGTAIANTSQASDGAWSGEHPTFMDNNKSNQKQAAIPIPRLGRRTSADKIDNLAWWRPLYIDESQLFLSLFTLHPTRRHTCISSAEECMQKCASSGDLLFRREKDFRARGTDVAFRTENAEGTDRRPVWFCLSFPLSLLLVSSISVNPPLQICDFRPTSLTTLHFTSSKVKFDDSRHTAVHPFTNTAAIRSYDSNLFKPRIARS